MNGKDSNKYALQAPILVPACRIWFKDATVILKTQSEMAKNGKKKALFFLERSLLPGTEELQANSQLSNIFLFDYLIISMNHSQTDQLVWMFHIYI